MATLKDFPRPSVAVDVAVCTVVDGRLCMVLWRRTGPTAHHEWALPGSFVREREQLGDAVERTLRDKCGIAGLAPTQLAVMDDPNRDNRGWVLSVAHLDVVTADALGARRDDAQVRLAPVLEERSPRGSSLLALPDNQARLPFDHDIIVGLALETLRDRYAERPDPTGLLGDRFTILRLRNLHEAVAGAPLQKDTFRRAMLPHLTETGDVEQGIVGRPAQLFAKR